MLYFDEFDEIEETDDLIMWITVQEIGIPEEIKRETIKIDKENYNKNCFGICIGYKKEKAELYIYEGVPGHELYYTDNNGNNRWLHYKLNEIEKYFFFAKCIKKLKKMKMI